MYRFDPTISSVVEEAAAPVRQALSAEEPAESGSQSPQKLLRLVTKESDRLGAAQVVRLTA